LQNQALIQNLYVMFDTQIPFCLFPVL
jgi:hypothetical protein